MHYKNLPGLNNFLHLTVYMKARSCMVCLLAAALAGSVLLLAMNMPIQALTEYRASLSPDMLSRLESIRAERQSLATMGIVLGALLAIPFADNWCYSLFVAFGVQHLYYTLSPKSDWMLRHHHTPEQNRAWVALYREMTVRSHVGLVVGALVYAVVSVSLGPGLPRVGLSPTLGRRR